MNQTIALLIDAYRDLNSKKLFWITMILSGSIILAMGSIGTTDTEMSFFWFHWHPPGFLDPHLLYRSIVVSFIMIGLWLSWGAIILALISTAGIFPELISGGSIDLYLSKPIGRLRLFLTKYLTSLLFVLAQVSVFSVGCFLMIGVRAHEWRPSVFLAIPFITLLFSYVYSVCVLVGMWSRSTVAALLLSILIWLFFSGVQHLEQISHVWTLGTDFNIKRVENDLRYFELHASAPPKSLIDLQPGLSRKRKELSLQRLTELHSKQRIFLPLHRGLEIAKSLVPKTIETNDLLDRWLIRDDELAGGDTEQATQQNLFDIDSRDDAAATKQVIFQSRAQPASYIIGTSLLSEAVILSIAAWMFCRRDY